MKVWVARYEHKYGTDVRVFRTIDGPVKWRQELAAEWWSDVFPDRPMPADPEKAADAYFDKMSSRDEFFQWEEAELED